MVNTAKLGSFIIEYTNKEEYRGIKEEIFHSKIYYFHIQTSSPIIIDCGSHIGMSIIYFKSLFPNAVIFGYEPNPISYDLLKKNIQNNGLKEIILNNVAVDIKKGDKSFYIDTTKDLWLSTAGYINGSWKKIFKDEEYKVTTLDFAKEIERILGIYKRIDILKIDIEGFETKLIPHISKYLDRVENLAIEYHPITKHGLKKVLDILYRNYHNIEFVQNGKKVKSPDTNELVIIKCTNGKE